MQTVLRTSGGEYHCWRRAKKIVIVVEGVTDHINDIIDSIIIPREVSADHTLTLCAVGTADDGQYREILKVLSAHNCVLPQ